MNNTFTHYVEETYLDKKKYGCRVRLRMVDDNKVYVKLLTVFDGEQSVLLNDEDYSELEKQCVSNLQNLSGRNYYRDAN